MTRLTSLNPRWGMFYRDRELTANNGGFPTERFDLSFNCPVCGPPYRIIINIEREAKASPITWQAVPLPDGPDWPERVTIIPSIDNTAAGHGKKHPTCGFHGTITNGEVTLA